MPAVSRFAKSQSVSSGFTLIELVVVIGVLAIVTAIAGDIIVSTFRSYNKSDTVNRLEQNGNYALNLMAQRLRNAREVTGVSSCGAGLFKELNITTHAGGHEAFTLLGSVGGNGYIGYDQTGFTDGTALTDYGGNDAVDVLYDTLHCGEAGYSWFKVDTSDSSVVVTIQLHLRQSVDLPSRQDYQASTTLKTSVVVRAY